MPMLIEGAMKKLFYTLFIAFLLLLTAFCGCAREGIYDLAKYGADLVYALGFDGTSTKFYTARDGYYDVYDTGTTFAPLTMAAGRGGVFALIPGGWIYTHFGPFSAGWSQLAGAAAGSVSHMVDYKDEVLLIDDSVYLYRLHQDSYMQPDAYQDYTDISPALGVYGPITMFKTHDTDEIYIVALNAGALKIFSVSGGGIGEVITPDPGTFIFPGGAVLGAGKKGGYFYVFEDSVPSIFKMSASIPTAGTTYNLGPGVISMAVTESGIYTLFMSAGVHFQKFNESTGTASDIRTFATATAGQLLPFDRDGVAIRITDIGPDNGVWLYQDGEFKHIISSTVEAMYVR